MNLQGLTVWMVTPESSTRGKLREVINALIYKASIRVFKNSRESMEILNKGEENPHILFVSYSLGKDSISDFLGQLNSLAPKRHVPVVVTLDSKVGDNSTSIAALYLQGISGFISEPYSTSELSDLLRTIIENKNQAQGKDRVMKATAFLLSDAMAQLDLLALQMWRGEEPSGYPLRELKIISRNLQQAFDQDPLAYGTIASDIFSKAKPPASNVQKVKRKTVTKALHPGAVIKQLMQERMLTPERVALMLKMELPDFESLVKEERSIDEELAKELSRVLGRTAREWIRLQSEFEARGGKKKAEASSHP